MQTYRWNEHESCDSSVFSDLVISGRDGLVGSVYNSWGHKRGPFKTHYI